LFDLTTVNPLRWLVAESTRRGYSKINCFTARFQAVDGVATLRSLALDTPNVIASGEGSIDFARETLDLRFDPRERHRIAAGPLLDRDDPHGTDLGRGGLGGGPAGRNQGHQRERVQSFGVSRHCPHACSVQAPFGSWSVR
jgi:hypothetical protein